MIILGIVLLIVGFMAAAHIIWILGIIALVVRAVVCFRDGVGGVRRPEVRRG